MSIEPSRQSAQPRLLPLHIPGGALPALLRAQKPLPILRIRGLALPGSLPLVAAVLASFALGLGLLSRFPLREDEAVYGYWALHFLHADPWFLTVWPDKPPIFLWLLAAAFSLMGPGEASARWINVAATTLLVPVTAALARRLVEHRGSQSSTAKLAATVTAASLALNPYTVSFAPTAYTDPVMVLAGMAGLACAARGRAFWAGFWLAVAAMTKQQGLLYAPLGLLLLTTTAAPSAPRTAARSIGLMLAGAALVVVPILAWDAARWRVAPSPWDWSTRTYAALALVPPGEWPERARAWAALAWHFAGSRAAWLWLAALLLLAALSPPQQSPLYQRGARRFFARGLQATPAFWLAAWSIAFIAAHLLISVQTWDRYLLPLAPMLALGIGALCARVFSAHRRAFPAVALAGLLVMIPPALTAAAGGYPVGGDHGAYSGLREMIDALQARTAADQRIVLYHHALGWHYRFYLFDEIETGHVDLRWFPSALYLADNAAKTPYPPTYWIRPHWLALPNLDLHLAQRNLAQRTLAQAGNFALVEIVHQPQSSCDWCLCAPPRAPAIASAITAQPLTAQPGPMTLR